jgi:hypothetical protein
MSSLIKRDKNWVRQTSHLMGQFVEITNDV